MPSHYNCGYGDNKFLELTEMQGIGQRWKMFSKIDSD